MKKSHTVLETVARDHYLPQAKDKLTTQGRFWAYVSPPLAQQIVKLLRAEGLRVHTLEFQDMGERVFCLRGKQKRAELQQEARERAGSRQQSA